ncbi:MAG: helix-turn-helix domain-containing protein [Clostridia bacterium]|nr:helix-turn-helix domain-containing protein [Clostridia bacterium]
MKVLNFGSCNVDHVYAVDHIIKAGETLAARSVDVFAGGKGLNQSIALAKAGVSVYHAGIIGEDGTFLKDTLVAAGVDVRFLKTEKGKSGHAIIQVDSNGENCICVFEGTNGSVTEDYIDEVLSNFEQGDFIILQNEIPHVDHILTRAKEIGMISVLNPSPINERITALDLSCVGYLILNETEAREISGKSDTREFIGFIRAKYPSLRVVLTLGSRGSVYFTEDEMTEMPAFCVEAKDTTSAGDTFTGYFISFVSSGKSVKEALKYASAASAITVSRLGASASVPYLKEVEEILPSLIPSRTDTEDRKSLMKKKIEEYITSCPKTASLSGLSTVLGYSRTYAAALVKETTGYSFTELLLTERCRKAAALLEKDECVGDIIKEVGYENCSFFRKKFKEIYGKTPKEYQKELRRSKT